MTSRRLFPLLLCLIMTSLGSTALVTADCNPDPASNGDTVSCPDDQAGVDDADGFDGEGVSSLNVTVETGATVENTNAYLVGIRVGPDGSVTNNGTVTASGDAVAVDNGGIVENNGTLQGDYGVFDNFGGDTSIDNNGL